MSSDSSNRFPEWEEDWLPPKWGVAPETSSTRSSRAVAGKQSSAALRRTVSDRPSEKPKDLLQLAIAPAITAVMAFVLWVLSPLPGAGPSPAPLFIIAIAQIIAILMTRDDRPPPVTLPWLTHLAATVGLLPLLAIQVSLLREPYVALGEGSAWPAVIATVVALGFAIVLAVSTSVRFWRQPDQAALVFLPGAMLIPAAIGQRSEITITTALSILAFTMALGALATLFAAPLTLGKRLLVPPVALAVEIIVLWVADRGPVFHPTSGGIVRVLYLVLLFGAIALLILVPVLAVWLRRTSASLPPPPAPGVPR
jgi:hypothetical protein